MVAAVMGVRQLMRAYCSPEVSVVDRGLRVTMVFLLVYFLGVVLLMAFTGGDVTLSPRILLPMMVVCLPFAAMVLREQFKNGWRSWGLWLALALLALGVLRTGQLAWTYHQRGAGYSGKDWTSRELVKTVKTLSDEVPVYSNDPEAFFYYANRPAALIPPEKKSCAGALAAARMTRDFEERNAVAVIFNAEDFVPASRWWSVVREVPLKVAWRDSWGVIYTAAKPMARAQ
jgi:hypothetical protein